MTDPESGRPRRRVLEAMIVTTGWSFGVVQCATLQWTPDCGGVAYGFPLPFVQTSMASSLLFQLSVPALVVNLVATTFTLMIVAVPCLRSVRIATGSTWKIVGALLLVPWLTSIGLVLPIAAGFYIPTTTLQGPVYEWRSVSPWLGPPDWDIHLEPACD